MKNRFIWRPVSATFYARYRVKDEEKGRYLFGKDFGHFSRHLRLRRHPRKAVEVGRSVTVSRNPVCAGPSAILWLVDGKLAPPFGRTQGHVGLGVLRVRYRLMKLSKNLLVKLHDFSQILVDG